MARTDGLKSYKKGQSGNPKGRPKGSKNRSTIAKYWLEAMQKIKNPINGKLEELSQEDAMTLAMINKARKGDVNAYSKLMDSAYGQAKQTNEVDVNGSLNIINLGNGKETNETS